MRSEQHSQASLEYLSMCDELHVWQKHKLTHEIQLKEVGSSHEDAPDVSLHAHASSDPTAQISWMKEPTHTMCGPLLYQMVMRPAAHAVTL